MEHTHRVFFKEINPKPQLHAAILICSNNWPVEACFSFKMSMTYALLAP